MVSSPHMHTESRCSKKVIRSGFTIGSHAGNKVNTEDEFGTEETVRDVNLPEKNKQNNDQKSGKFHPKYLVCFLGERDMSFA